MIAVGSMLYVVWVGTEQALELDDLVGPQQQLATGLTLVESKLTRSRLYHLVKWSLPEGTPLLVAAVDGEPKFKGMAPGSLAWLRSRDRT